jgi:predicted dehydrogenase
VLNGGGALMDFGCYGADLITWPNADPLSYLAAVVRGEIKPSGLSSLDVNMVATEILEAARKSAQTGKRVMFH